MVFVKEAQECVPASSPQVSEVLSDHRRSSSEGELKGPPELGQGWAAPYRAFWLRLREASDGLRAQGTLPCPSASSVIWVPTFLGSSSEQEHAGQVGAPQGARGSQTGLSPSRALFASWISAAVGREEGLEQVCGLWHSLIFLMQVAQPVTRALTRQTSHSVPLAGTRWRKWPPAPCSESAIPILCPL